MLLLSILLDPKISKDTFHDLEMIELRNHYKRSQATDLHQQLQIKERSEKRNIPQFALPWRAWKSKIPKSKRHVEFLGTRHPWRLLVPWKRGPIYNFDYVKTELKIASCNGTFAKSEATKIIKGSIVYEYLRKDLHPNVQRWKMIKMKMCYLGWLLPAPNASQSLLQTPQQWLVDQSSTIPTPSIQLEGHKKASFLMEPVALT